MRLIRTPPDPAFAKKIKRLSYTGRTYEEGNTFGLMLVSCACSVLDLLLSFKSGIFHPVKNYRSAHQNNRWGARSQEGA
jgi:hypothetical protein